MKRALTGLIIVLLLAQIGSAGWFWDDYKINVYRVEGAGSVEVFRNGESLGELSETESGKAFGFDKDNSFAFKAKPASGWVFEKFCADSACSIVSTSNPFTGKATANGNVFVYFKKSIIPPIDEDTKSVLMIVGAVLLVLFLVFSGAWRIIFANPLIALLVIIILIALYAVMGIISGLDSILDSIGGLMPWNWW